MLPLLPPWALVALAAAALLSAPLWLPAHVVRLRVWLFTLINGPDGLSLPNAALDPVATRRLYEHPGARLRSTQRSVGLSDLFWFLLQPGADLHQEHTESGTALHAGVSGATKTLLAVPPAELDALVADAVAWRLRTFAATTDGSVAVAPLAGGGPAPWRVLRLRDFLFPMVARFWYGVCFGPPPDPAVDPAGAAAVDADVAALAASGRDVIDALKALKMRNTGVRDAATAVAQRLLTTRLGSRAAAAYSGPIADGVLTPAEAALALQGVIFHTGTVQLTDALTHLALALAQCEDREGGGGSHRSGWDRVAADAAAGVDGAGTASAGSGDATADAGAPGHNSFLHRAMHEAMRVWPLFGVAHRIADRDIVVAADAAGGDAATAGGATATTTIPAGTVLCFNYTALHGAGIPPADDPAAFRPERWLSLRGKDLPAYVPFGVPRNRPCPAQRLCLAAVPSFTRALAAGLRLWSPAEHTRSLPGRGVAVVQLRPRQTQQTQQQQGKGAAATAAAGASPAPSPPLGVLLPAVKGVDLLDGLALPLTQLVCGTALVLQARAAALAHRYHTLGVTPRGGPIPPAQK